MSKKRLDEILLAEGLITEDQIKQALELQKSEGGKFGSALLKHNFIDELSLVKALSKQHGCEGVIIKDLEIPQIVLKFLPARVAHSRTALPFDYDIDNNVIKIACEDPTNKTLLNELNFIATGKKVKLYMAADVTLKEAINKYYQIDPEDLTQEPIPQQVQESLPDEPSALISDEVERIPVYETEKEPPPVEISIKEVIPKDLENLFYKNLEIMTNLLSFKCGFDNNHSGAVGSYVDKLCRSMNIDVEDRICFVNAGFFHNIAGFNYNIDESEDVKKPIEITINFLESVNYSKDVIKVIRNMYRELNEDDHTNPSKEVLGANILTIIDMFCNKIKPGKELTLDQFEDIKRQIQGANGKLLLENVVDAFTILIDEEVLPAQQSIQSAQTMIYYSEEVESCPIEERLKIEGFRTISAVGIESFLELYARSKPEFLILVPNQEKEDIHRLIILLHKEGIKFYEIPTYLIVESEYVGELIYILEDGIEDIISKDSNLDLLYVKLRKFQTQIFKKKKADSILKNITASSDSLSKSSNKI